MNGFKLFKFSAVVALAFAASSARADIVECSPSAVPTADSGVTCRIGFVHYAQFTTPDSVVSNEVMKVVPVSPGGPVAMGQAQAQQDPQTGKVAIVMAPPVDQLAKGGGLIQLSAFGWLEPYVDTVVQALIVAFFGWIGKSKYTQWLDQSSRDALEVFVKNRASSLLADGAVKMQGKAVQVDNGFLYRAATESATAIPDALKRFNLTPDVVAQKIVDAIPQTTAGAAMVAGAHAEDDSHPVPIERPSPAAPGFIPPTGPAAA